MTMQDETAVMRVTWNRLTKKGLVTAHVHDFPPGSTVRDISAYILANPDLFPKTEEKTCYIMELV